MTDDEPIPPERLERARRLAEAAGPVRLPYPSREATDPADAGLLLMLEQMSDPEWLARHWLDPGPEEMR